MEELVEDIEITVKPFKPFHYCGCCNTITNRWINDTPQCNICDIYVCNNCNYGHSRRKKPRQVLCYKCCVLLDTNTNPAGPHIKPKHWCCVRYIRFDDLEQISKLTKKLGKYQKNHFFVKGLFEMIKTCKETDTEINDVLDQFKSLSSEEELKDL